MFQRRKGYKSLHQAKSNTHVDTLCNRSYPLKNYIPLNKKYSSGNPEVHRYLHRKLNTLVCLQIQIAHNPQYIDNCNLQSLFGYYYQGTLDIDFLLENSMYWVYIFVC